jgi:hypothetical protein
MILYIVYKIQKFSVLNLNFFPIFIFLLFLYVFIIIFCFKHLILISNIFYKKL